MISSVTEHYANHLAPIYSWMVGDFDIACSQADGFYSDISLPDGNGSVAVDLGCGHGLHPIAIGRRGYRVLAIDTSAHLLSEMNGRIGELPIQIIDADLTKSERDQVGSQPSVVWAPDPGTESIVNATMAPVFWSRNNFNLG
jgi:2-polyprenyl-3-methyl-5-hydroxy-6-metoxy-1,4-benzoquinol methylase